MLELLYREHVTPDDGPRAIVLSPTRELAMQIFQVVRTAGSHHAFSVGLLIGGQKKDFEAEQRRVGSTNILIASPGRLLQHLEQTPYFDMSGLRMLVLDEADRILDMGFRDQLARILEYLPSSEDRQTLLFSATQTRDVNQLAALSLRDPEYLGVHDKERTLTPENLQQSYVVVPIEHKLNALYSFLRSHLKTKCIVFLSSCAQIRHAWELFCSIRPGIPVLALHGKIVQDRRTHIYFDFCQRPHAVLLASDVCARGLDFPHVDWVIQLDAPEDRDMYVHRVGRTARYRSGGKSLLFVTPSEEKRGLIQKLLLQEGTNSNNHSSSSSKLPIKKVNINPNKTAIVTQRAASLVAAKPKLGELAKKAYKSYVRSIHLMPDKQVFCVRDIPADAYAQSLGLALTPNLSFLRATPDRDEARKKKNVNHKLHKLKEQIKTEKLAKKLQAMGRSVSAEDVLTASVGSRRKRAEAAATGGPSLEAGSQGSDDDDDDDDDEVLVSKSVLRWEEKNNDDNEPLPEVRLNEVSKPRHPKKIRIQGSNSTVNTRIVFNDDGEEVDAKAALDIRSHRPRGDRSSSRMDPVELHQASQDFVSQVRKRLQNSREQDLQDERERVRQKHKKRRLKEKGGDDLGRDDSGATVTLTAGRNTHGSGPATADGEQSISVRSASVSSSSSSSVSSSSSQASSDEEDHGEPNVAEQEELALSLIRGRNLAT
jgi:ATP-dependent RNA helicase DDX10/DBP4